MTYSMKAVAGNPRVGGRVQVDVHPTLPKRRRRRVSRKSMTYTPKKITLLTK